ncbi:programmed cell death protein 2-like [Lingula anatina]|uniref:Programmed cell death protein 2-like n=1 Tax=Lingula anatina TaxID=7574 RepID=A0A1S3H7V7_LINAN|nr:programmed cell death protein 2-like [Lingula anatina]|eukprot:XP_013382200.1 programmed cell death protein 2-like [Lingula anatina]
MRSQLPKMNSFYSDKPPDEDHFDEKADYPRASKYQTLCSVCNCSASKFCARCHSQAYCSKEHQVVDWKNGHKLYCGKDMPEKEKQTASSKVCFPEFELLIESEEFSDSDKEDEKSEEAKLEEYRHYMESNQEAMSHYDSKSAAKDLEKMAGQENEDYKQFIKFKMRIQQEPDQVLRYDRGGSPLWVSVHNVPEPSDIPNCSCGKPRQFEFQVG